MPTVRTQNASIMDFRMPYATEVPRPVVVHTQGAFER
jgi:hypothetical protein